MGTLFHDKKRVFLSILEKKHGGYIMSSVTELILGFIWISGWICLIVGILGITVSLISGGTWIVVPVVAILVGVVFVWGVKKISTE